MYRGVNVFDVYVDRENNEEMMRVIKNDPELACKAQCLNCDNRECWNKTDKLREEYERRGTPIAEQVKKEGYDGPAMNEIDAQEVYLGYDPVNDVFISGWDVFNKPTCGAVAIGFRIGEDGKMYYPSHDEYDAHRTGLEIYDASNHLFYARGKTKNSRGEEVDIRGMYDMMRKAADRPDGPFKLVDIRLD